MRFVEILLSLISEKGISKNQFLKDLHLAKGSLSNWENRGAIPNGESLSKIADYFDVSVDYLLGKTSIKKEPVPDELEQAQKLANMFAEHDIDISKMSESEMQNLTKFISANKEFIRQSFNNKFNDKK